MCSTLNSIGYFQLSILMRLIASLHFPKHCQLTFSGIRKCCWLNSSLAFTPSSRIYRNYQPKSTWSCVHSYIWAKARDYWLQIARFPSPTCVCVCERAKRHGIDVFTLNANNMCCRGNSLCSDNTCGGVVSGEYLAYKHTKCNQAYFGEGKKQTD